MTSFDDRDTDEKARGLGERLRALCEKIPAIRERLQRIERSGVYPVEHHIGIIYSSARCLEEACKPVPLTPGDVKSPPSSSPERLWRAAKELVLSMGVLAKAPEMTEILDSRPVNQDIFDILDFYSREIQPLIGSDDLRAIFARYMEVRSSALRTDYAQTLRREGFSFRPTVRPPSLPGGTEPRRLNEGQDEGRG